MSKNIFIAVLLVLVIAEGAYILKKRRDVTSLVAMLTERSKTTDVGKSPAPKPLFITKGAKLADSPIGQFAFKIAPGELSAEAKAAMTGYAIVSKAQRDGSIVVSLTPKDADGQSQVYTVKSGETLYFVEQTPLDDKADQDKDLNYRDDYGIIVDKDGLVL